MSNLGIIRNGEYYDSISIMLMAKQVAAINGIMDSAVVLGTPGNKAALESSGMMTAELLQAEETDLIVAVKTDDSRPAADTIAEIQALFRSIKNKSEHGDDYPRSLDTALNMLPDASLVMISIAGRYAGDVAMESLRRDRHVFLFSDNVPVETEIELKEFARSKRLFVMGPDCGTAIINGVPLGFANVVNRGTVGIVAASGTGLQEVTSLISNAGCGISQAIGTGGRDVKQRVGGLMFIEGIHALAADPGTEVIVLLSKPPDPPVLGRILDEVSKVRKPVIGIFLGAESGRFAGTAVIPAVTLEEGAAQAVALARKQPALPAGKTFASRSKELQSEASAIASKLRPEQRYLRALFSGGTFCDEAQLLARDRLKSLSSNTPIDRVKKLADAWKSSGHTIVDLGDDEFTVGTPHPMIDYSTRRKRFAAEVRDPQTAVILLDIVLGYGSAPDPLGELLPAIRQAKDNPSLSRIPVICSVTGTDKDPQNRSLIIAGLREAGCIVRESNAAASELAIAVAAIRESRP